MSAKARDPGVCGRLGNSDLCLGNPIPGMGFVWPSQPATSSSHSQPPTQRERTDRDRKIQKASNLISAARGKDKTVDTGQFEPCPWTAPQIQSVSQLQTIIWRWHWSCLEGSGVKAEAAEAMLSCLQESGPRGPAGNQGRGSRSTDQDEIWDEKPVAGEGW